MAMKSSDLHNLWDGPDNSRLTPKQFSFRLPVHVAAKLAAIGEMYPRKSRTEIVGDLLSAALEEFAETLPFEMIEVEDPYLIQEGHTHEQAGPKTVFRYLTSKHLQELEKEMAGEAPATTDLSGTGSKP